MAKIITEQMIEDAAMDLFRSKGFKTLNAYTSSPENMNDGTCRKSKKETVLPKILIESLKRLNPQIPESVLARVVGDISNSSTS